MFNSSMRIWGLNCTLNTEEKRWEIVQGKGHVTNSTDILRPAFPSLLPPNAITSISTTCKLFCHWEPKLTRVAVPATCIRHFQRVGSATWLSSPTAFRHLLCQGEKVQTHSLIKHSNDFMGTLHFVLFWLPSQGVGGPAHLQTPASLNGDSCMQRACLQPAWCSGR